MADENTEGAKPEADNVTFEAWLEGQSDEVKNRFKEGTQGLQNALNSERNNTKGLSKQLKDLQAKADKDSDLAKQLTEMQEKLTESERHSAFVDGASAAGCNNVKAAYKLAKGDPDLWKRDGSPDWEAIKAEAPELFGKKNPNGNAGNGTNDEGGAGSKNYMDNLIRKQLHRN